MSPCKFLNIKQIALMLVRIGFACWLAVAGALASFMPIQAAVTLTINYTGSESPAVVGTSWSRIYTASGGESPYRCSVSGEPSWMSISSDETAGTCTLSGTPTDTGSYSLEISFTDNDIPKNSGSTVLNLDVYANTSVDVDISSSHPNGDSYFMAGYPVWVSISVVYSPAISGKIPAGSILVSSGAGGPTCSVTLDANGQGECALIFPNAETRAITANFTASSLYTYDSSYSGSDFTLAVFSTPPTLSAGRYHTCYLSSSGTMTCWGLTDNFPVDVNDNPEPQSTYAKISSGGYQTCGIKTDGTLACWGDNTDVTSNVPSGYYVDINSGDEHVCAIDVYRRLHCWGSMSSELSLNIPTVKVTAVDAGVGIDCAIKKDNQKAVCWGSSTATSSNTLASVAVGNTHVCAIRNTGALECWGSGISTPPSGTNFVTVESGSNYSCAQKSDGKLDCWGTGSPVVDETNTFDAFSSGFLHTCALKPGVPQTLSCWGDNSFGKAPAISFTPTNFLTFMATNKTYSQTFTATGGKEPYTFSLSSGSLPTGMNLSNGTVSGTPTAAGDYNFNLSVAETYTGGGLPLELSPKIQSYSTTVIDGTTTTSLSVSPDPVDAGSAATATVTVTKIPASPTITGGVVISSTDGDTSCRTTVNASGQASCQLYFSTSGSKTVTVQYEGDEFYSPSSGSDTLTVNPVTISPVVGAGAYFSCSINSSGQLTCWGKNQNYQSTPPGSGVFNKLDLGQFHACGLALNHKATCWGWNGYNIATIPTTANLNDITTGYQHTCALTDSGTATCWGESSNSKLSVPVATYTDIDAGAYHTCGVTSTGGVNCWGLNSYGQTSVPADLTTRGLITQVSAGESFSCGLHQDGTVECWGGTGLIDAIRTEPAGTFIQVSAGKDFACGLKSDGSAACWGSLTNVPSGVFSNISAGMNHACGILSDGNMQCWGDNISGQAPAVSVTPLTLASLDAGIYAERQISALGGRSTSFSFSISSGTLPPGMTLNSTNGLISGTPSQAGVYTFSVKAQETGYSPALAGSQSYTLIVRGLVEAKIESVLPLNVMAGRPVTVNFSVHAQTGNTMGVEPIGIVTVTAQGNTCQVNLVNGAGSCRMLFATAGVKPISISYPGDSLYQADTNAEAVTNFTVIAFSQAPTLRSATEQTYIYKADGSLGCVGTNCALTKLSGVFTRFEAFGDYACGLHTDGSLICSESNGATPRSFNSGPYIDLGVTGSHICAVQLDGTIECQGDISGVGAPPAGVYSSLSVTDDFDCALTESGSPVCWSAGTPVIPAAGPFVHLTAGSGHICGITAGGAVSCWGDNLAGQSTVPTTPTAFNQIDAGGDVTCGLDSSGKVSCWGDASHGQTQSIYGTFTAVSTSGDHVCALRDGLKLTCWGSNIYGEAPQYTYKSLVLTEIPALAYFEHVFNISGGTKPLTAEVAGTLPVGMEVGSVSGSSVALAPIGGVVVNDISPAGMVFYGTPTVPGNYAFVFKWTDVSEYPVVMEQPYTLTITGGDLAVRLEPYSTADALQGLDYKFKAVVSTETVLAVPGVEVTINLPEGLTNITADNPGCSLAGNEMTCDLVSVDPAAPVTIWITGQVVAKAGDTLEMSASATAHDLVTWPEIDSSDNADSLSVDVAARAEVYSEDFNLTPFEEWTGGLGLLSPNSQTYLSGTSDETIRLDLTGLPDHKNLLVYFDLYIIGGWQGNNDGGAASEWSFGQSGLAPMLDTTFSNLDAYSQAYPGPFPGNNYAAFSGANGINILGWTSGSDPVPDARYQMKYKFAHSTGDAHLVFSSSTLPAGATWGLDHVRVEVDAGLTMIYLPVVQSSANP